MNQTPRLFADVVTRELEEELVLYDPRSDRLALLNRGAAEVVALCDGSHTVGDIASELARRFDLRPAGLRTHVEATLRELALNGFLES